MAAYGNHPTIYGNLSDDALYAMYRRESWLGLDESARQQLLQETVNRAALANGEEGACRVVFADLPDGVAGEQSGDEIRLDRNRYVNDMAVTEYNGEIYTMELEDSNMQALTTVLHEDIHAWQNQLIDGTIECDDPALLAEYQANNFDIALVQKSDGTYALGQQYLQGQSENGGYYLYYLQSTERDAHRLSEAKTQSIMQALEEKYGTEPSFELYRQNLKENGYDAVLKKAQENFGALTVEKDINTTLKNHYHGTDTPVTSAEVEAAVKEEMVLSMESRMALQTNDSLQTGTEEAAPAVTSESLSDAGTGAENSTAATFGSLSAAGTEASESGVTSDGGIA